jgi:hypothetical protein
MRVGYLNGRLFAQLLLLLIILGAAFARDIPLVDKQFAPEWWAMASAALLISVFFVAGHYMIGELFQMPESKSLAKQELYELGVSIFLIIFILATMMSWGWIAHDITLSSLEPNGKTPVIGNCTENERYYNASDPAHPENLMYRGADYFLGCEPLGSESVDDISKSYDPKTMKSFYEPVGRGVLLTEMMNQYISLISLEMMLGPISTFGVSWFLPEAIVTRFDISVSPMAGLTPISEALIIVTDLVGVGVGTVLMQKLLLLFIHQNVLVIFLPLGLAARGVPFLRKTGSTIIAVCMVLYFVYPLTLWLNQQVYFGIQDKLINWANYASIAEICQVKSGESAQAFQDRITTSLQDYMATGAEVGSDFSDSGGSGDGAILPWSTLKSFFSSLFGNLWEIVKFMFTPWNWALGPMLPVNYFFEALVDMMTVAMQIFVLNMLFLVNSIIICVTIFRDLSLAIGGEPKIFGISKLV